MPGENLIFSVGAVDNTAPASAAALRNLGNVARGARTWASGFQSAYSGTVRAIGRANLQANNVGRQVNVAVDKTASNVVINLRKIGDSLTRLDQNTAGFEGSSVRLSANFKAIARTARDLSDSYTDFARTSKLATQNIEELGSTAFPTAAKIEFVSQSIDDFVTAAGATQNVTATLVAQLNALDTAGRAVSTSVGKTFEDLNNAPQRLEAVATEVKDLSRAYNNLHWGYISS